MILLSIILVGCSSDSVDKLWQTHKQESNYRAKLLKTQKAILQINDIKTYIIATYIGSSKNHERFIISLYTNGDTSIRFGKDYHISVSSKKPISIKKLTNDDKLLKEISFKTEWRKYYLVDFPFVDKDKLYMIFTDKKGSEVKLYFAKKAKYTL